MLHTSPPSYSLLLTRTSVRCTYLGALLRGEKLPDTVPADDFDATLRALGREVDPTKDQ